MLPATVEDRACLLDALLLERAVDELDNALVHRPAAVAVTTDHLANLLTGPRGGE